jgi:hypothetical protein
MAASREFPSATIPGRGPRRGLVGAGRSQKLAPHVAFGLLDKMKRTAKASKERRSGRDRRTATDRRELPPRPEGRRRNGGRRATDPADA